MGFDDCIPFKTAPKFSAKKWPRITTRFVLVSPFVKRVVNPSRAGNPLWWTNNFELV